MLDLRLPIFEYVPLQIRSACFDYFKGCMMRWRAVFWQRRDHPVLLAVKRPSAGLRTQDPGADEDVLAVLTSDRTAMRSRECTALRL